MHCPFPFPLPILSALLLAGGTALGQITAWPTTQELRAKIDKTVPARLGEEVEFALVPGGAAVCVELAPNLYDLSDFVVYLDAERIIWFDYGHGSTGKASKSVDGALDQIGRAPCAALARWQRGEREWSVGLLVTDRREQIEPVLAGIESGQRKWALRLTNGSLAARAAIPETERIAGFVRLWSEVKYNFVLFDRVPELDWEGVLVSWLPRVRAAETAPAYYRVLRECMAQLKDGHSEVYGPSDEPTAALPLALTEVEGKAVVAAVVPAAAIRDATRQREIETARLQRGDEVVAIDGVPVQEILQREIHPVLSSSTPQWLAVKAYRLLGRGEPGTVATLLVRPLQGAEREVVLTRGYLTASRAPARREDGEVEDGIVYVAIDGFGSEDDVVHFDALLPRIRQARGLIIDVRRNGGGSTSIAAKVIASLTDRKLPGSRWKTRMHRPAFKAWGQPEEWHAGKHADVAPARDPFLGPVVVLIGPETFSAAEDFLVVLKASERATLVGSRTAGSTGQPLRIELPGGGGARVCSKRDTFPDGTEFVGIGVLPDVEVTVTRQDFVAGRDVVLERGLEELRRRIAR